MAPRAFNNKSSSPQLHRALLLLVMLLLLLLVHVPSASAAARRYLRAFNTSNLAVAAPIPANYGVRDRQAAAEAIEMACRTCETSINIPVDFEVETAAGRCEAKLCTYKCENCFERDLGVLGKHKVCAGGLIDCTTRSSEQCGEVCFDGVPTHVEPKWEEINVCAAAMEYPAAVGAAADIETLVDVVNRGFDMCPCLGQVPEFVAKFQEMDWRTAVMSGAGELSDCLITAGFKVQDNLAEAEQSGDLSESGGDKILRGPPIDLALYLKITSAGAGCVVGATCDTVIQLVLEYFKDAAAEISKGLVEWLKTQVQGAMNAAVGSATAVVDGVATPLANVQRQLAACNDAAAAQAKTAVGELKTALDTAQQTVTDVKELQATTAKAVEAVQDMADALSKSYYEHLRDAIHDILQGDLDFLDTVNFMATSQDVVTALQNAQDFAKAAPTLQRQLTDLQTAGSKAQDALAALGGGGGQQQQQGVVGVLQGILGGNGGGGGGGGISGCSVDATGLVVTGDVARAAGTGLQDAQTRLAQLDPSNVQPGVATINRWFEVSADLPCYEMGECSLGPEPVAVKVDCPQIYVCHQQAEVAMPNEHIPYLRIKGGNA